MTGAIRNELPACCADCVFRQTLGNRDGGGRKDRLFRRAALARLGFRQERTSGPITLMRLELRGLHDVEQPAQTAAAPHGVRAVG